MEAGHGEPALNEDLQQEEFTQVRKRSAWPMRAKSVHAFAGGPLSSSVKNNYINDSPLVEVWEARKGLYAFRLHARAEKSYLSCEFCNYNFPGTRHYKNGTNDCALTDRSFSSSVVSRTKI